MDNKEVKEIFKKCTNQLFSLENIFCGKWFFRIPDYQRGYAWEKDDHLTVFWQDFERMRRHNGQHYMGMLCLEKANSTDKHDENLEGKDLYYIIDGQQRLTTCVILLSSLADRLEIIDKSSKSYKIIRKIYIQEDIRRLKYSKKRNENENKFLEEYIYRPLNEESKCSQDNYYLRRMFDAKKFFDEKLQNCSKDDCENIFEILAKNLIFNALFVSNEKNISSFDIRLMFETINNRGRELSNLEKLKNRLFYISDYLFTNLNKNDRERKKRDLRASITSSWNKIYDQLGNLSQGKSNNIDDDFLVAHWIMFSKGSVTKNGTPELNEIFNTVFTMDYALNDEDVRKFCGEVQEKAIENYINSLEKSSEYWVWMHKPKTIPQNISVDVQKLESLSHLTTSDKYVKSFILYLLSQTREHNLKIQSINSALEILEKYLFVTRFITSKRINYSFIATYLKELIQEKMLTKDQKLSKILKALIDGYDDDGEIKSKDGTINSMRKLLTLETVKNWINTYGKNFYGKWKEGLKFVLFEQNIKDFDGTNPNRKLLIWEDLNNNSIEHIFPQHPNQDENDLDGLYWKTALGTDKMSENGFKMMVNTLGNLIPLSQPINSSVSNKMYPRKKREDAKINDKTLYSYSSDTATANSIANKYEHWNVENLIERTKFMLKSISEKWLTIPENYNGCKNLGVSYDLTNHLDMITNFNYVNGEDLSQNIESLEFNVDKNALEDIYKKYKLEKEEEKRNASKKKKMGPRTPTIPFDEFINNKPQNLVDMLIEIKDKVLEKFPNSSLYVKKQYLSIKRTQTAFIEIHFRKNDLKIYTHTPTSQNGIGNTLPHNWALNYQIYYKSNNSLTDLINVVSQSYEQSK